MPYSSFTLQDFFPDEYIGNVRKNNYSKSYKNNNYRRFRKYNDYSRYSHSGDIYPQRHDMSAALRSAISRGHKSGNSTMPDYYRHSLELARKYGRRYKPLNKDDLAFALDLDVRRRGSSALNDYYSYEKELASLGVNINGKWTRGKFGHDTGST